MWDIVLLIWKLSKFHHIRYLHLLNGIHFRTPIENPFLRSFSTNFIPPAVHKIWKITQFGHYKAPKNKKIVFLGHFRLFEGYSYIRTPTVNQFLCSFWVVNQLPTILAQKMGYAHQVNPGNRPSKDSKTAAVSEFSITGRSPPSSTGLFLNIFSGEGNTIISKNQIG